MNKFDAEINSIRSEILALKTQYQKKSSQLRTIEYTIPITFQLHKENNRIQSVDIAEASKFNNSHKFGIITHRLDIDENDGRSYQTSVLNITHWQGSEEYTVRVGVIDSINPSDVAEIEGGREPTITINLIIESTVFLDDTLDSGD